MSATTKNEYIIALSSLRMTDLAKVGGKNASLGEMISQLTHLGVRVPGGFATTAEAFRDFLQQNHQGEILEKKINARLANLDVDNVKMLTETGELIRNWVLETPLPTDLEQAVRTAYQQLVANNPSDISFAVRSSTSICLFIQRPRYCLSRAQRIYP